MLPCIFTIHIHGIRYCSQVLLVPGSYQLSTNDDGAYRRNRCDIRATPSTMHNRVTPPHNPNSVNNTNVSQTLPDCNSRGSNVTQPQNGFTY